MSNWAVGQNERNILSPNRFINKYEKKPARLTTLYSNPYTKYHAVKPSKSFISNGFKLPPYKSDFTKILATRPTTPPTTNVFMNNSTTLRLFNLSSPYYKLRIYLLKKTHLLTFSNYFITNTLFFPS